MCVTKACDWAVSDYRGAGTTAVCGTRHLKWQSYKKKTKKKTGERKHVTCNQIFVPLYTCFQNQKMKSTRSKLWGFSRAIKTALAQWDPCVYFRVLGSSWSLKPQKFWSEASKDRTSFSSTTRAPTEGEIGECEVQGQVSAFKSVIFLRSLLICFQSGRCIMLLNETTAIGSRCSPGRLTVVYTAVAHQSKIHMNAMVQEQNIADICIILVSTTFFHCSTSVSDSLLPIVDAFGGGQGCAWLLWPLSVLTAPYHCSLHTLSVDLKLLCCYLSMCLEQSLLNIHFPRASVRFWDSQTWYQPTRCSFKGHFSYSRY